MNQKDTIPYYHPTPTEADAMRWDLPLLGQNGKLEKTNGEKYLAVGLSLVSQFKGEEDSRKNKEGGSHDPLKVEVISRSFNLCFFASPECRALCLRTAGKGGLNTVQAGRENRAKRVLSDIPRAVAQIEKEIEGKWGRKARKMGAVLAVRLNVLSDINWARSLAMVEMVKRQTAKGVRFYDYTASPTRNTEYEDIGLPIHITFSRKENNQADAIQKLTYAENVAVVFDTPKSKPLPKTWWGFPVVDARSHDFRFLDPVGVVAGLSALGKARKGSKRGFVVATS